MTQLNHQDARGLNHWGHLQSLVAGNVGKSAAQSPTLSGLRSALGWSCNGVRLVLTGTAGGCAMRLPTAPVTVAAVDFPAHTTGFRHFLQPHN